MFQLDVKVLVSDCVQGFLALRHSLRYQEEDERRWLWVTDRRDRAVTQIRTLCQLTTIIPEPMCTLFPSFL